MKRKKVGARIIAAALLSLLIILLNGCNGDRKETSALSTSLSVAEAAETADPQSFADNSLLIEGKVYTFERNNAYKFSSDGEGVCSSDVQTLIPMNYSACQMKSGIWLTTT